MNKYLNFLTRTAISASMSDREKFESFIESKMKEHFNTDEELNTQAIKLIENLLFTAQQDLLFKNATQHANQDLEKKIDELIVEIKKLQERI